MSEPVTREAYDALVKERDAARRVVEAARDALRKVVIHTAHLPGASNYLLVGLLASCARNARAGIDAIDASLPAASGADEAWTDDCRNEEERAIVHGAVRDELNRAAANRAKRPASGAKWEPKGAAHGVEARGERPAFDPEFNCPTHFAGGDPSCPACQSKQPRPLYADEPRVEAKPAPTFKNLDVVRHKRDGWIDTIVAIHERGDFVEYITRGQRVALPDEIEPATSAPSCPACGGAPDSPVTTSDIGVCFNPFHPCNLPKMDAPSAPSHDAKGVGEKGVEGDVAFRFVDDVVTPIFDKRGHTYDSLAVKEQLRAAIKAAVDEAVRAAYARGVEAEAKRRERMGL